MYTNKKPILVSACLAGEKCRFDGKSNEIEKIKQLVREKKAIPFCPECSGGLSTPRAPSEIIKDKVVNNLGEDVTENFKLGAQKALEICKENGIKTAILKAKSPSCGNTEIYDGSFSGNLIEGKGITAQLLEENNIQVFNEKDLDKLFSLTSEEF